MRKMFDTCFPHSRTIKKWFKTNDCKSGFSADSFTEMAAKNKKLVRTLMIDEVAIRHRAFKSANSARVKNREWRPYSKQNFQNKNF